jgi:hypothetical protein
MRDLLGGSSSGFASVICALSDSRTSPEFDRSAKALPRAAPVLGELARWVLLAFEAGVSKFDLRLIVPPAVFEAPVRGVFGTRPSSLIGFSI